MRFLRLLPSLATCAALGWIVIPFLILALFNYPSSDDYYDWMLLQKHGVIKATWHYYFNWSGRYFTHLVAFLLNPLHFGERIGGSVSAIIGIVFLVLNAYWVVRIFNSMFRFEQDYRPVFILLLTLFVCYLPFPSETVYWFTGMIAYMPGFSACMYWAFLNLKENRNKAEFVLWFLLPVFAGGSGEISLILMGWLLLLNGLNTSAKHRVVYGIICALFLIAAAVELLSPGSVERMKYFTETAGNPTRNLKFAFENSLHWLWYYLRDWLRSTPILLVALFCALGSKSIAHIRISRTILCAWGLGVFVPVAMLFVFHFGTGNTQLPGRLINMIYLFLQVYLFFTLYYIAKRFFYETNLSSTKLVWLGACMLIFQATYTSRWRGAVSDMRSLNAYVHSMDERLQATQFHRKSQTTKTLHVLPIQTRPFTSFFSELSADSSHWYNEGYAYYHGINFIQCAEPQNELLR